MSENNLSSFIFLYNFYRLFDLDAGYIKKYENIKEKINGKLIKLKKLIK